MAAETGAPDSIRRSQAVGCGEPHSLYGFERWRVAMLVLRVSYLMGRVYSAVFDDGDSKLRPEWPPHPSRLFSALVSAWGDGGAEPELVPALEWLERQPPPAIYAAECSVRKRVEAFVPVNDERSLPEGRSRKPRGFPSATLGEPDVYFVWNEGAPDEFTRALDRILLRTSSLGHPASLVAMEIVERVPEGRWSIWAPSAASGDRLRVPCAGRFADLAARF